MKVGRRLALSNKLREPRVESFGENESGTTKREYPPGFVEEMQTTRIPRGDLDALLRRESGTRRKVKAHDISDLASSAASLESGTHARASEGADQGAPASPTGSIAMPTPLLPMAVHPASLASETNETSKTNESQRAHSASSGLNRAEPMTELDVPASSLEHRALSWSLALVGVLVLVAGVVALLASRH